MPELPEVETTKRGIAPHITGKKLSSVIIRESRLRWPISPELEEQVSGRKLQAVERRGKYLLLRFNSGTALWHLGMSGNLRIVQANAEAGKHDHVDWVFGSHCVLRFNDPRRFGSLLWAGKDPYTHKLLTQLGPEPLSDEFDGEYLYQRSRGRSQAIKTFIMDSKVVVGVGNIYANEALFSSGIHPLKSCAKVSKARYQILADNIKSILTYAINRGGTTLRDFVGGDGKPGYFAQELQVYGHASKPCPICQKPLTEKRLSQRSTVYCVNCQR